MKKIEKACKENGNYWGNNSSFWRTSNFLFRSFQIAVAETCKHLLYAKHSDENGS